MRIVVKVGTNVLTDEKDSLDIGVLSQIADQIAELKKGGNEVVLVSSGAVGAGKELITIEKTEEEVLKRQVYSAIGQTRLMGIYADLFGKHGLICAQVLATREDFNGKEHYKNMKNCFEALLQDNIIPVVNENDVVSLTELMFTDNDELAGLTAFMISAEKLIILTNVDGIFNGSPSDRNSSVIPTIDFSDHNAEEHLSDKKSAGGRGGIRSKYDIGKKASDKGITTYIVNGKNRDAIPSVFNDDFPGTVFLPNI